MDTVLISGGTGLIGEALTKKLLQLNYKVIVLTRQTIAQAEVHNLSYAQWDPEKGTIDKNAIELADYIIHLAGANVGQGRWTQKRKNEIVQSRVKSGNLLVKALMENKNNVKAFISISAIGWYGPDKENTKSFTEEDPADNSFLGKTCQHWEGVVKPVQDLSIRLVIFRSGIVLSNNGGAYSEFKKPLKYGAATILGSGNQIISWIHIDDLVALFVYALNNDKIKGVYNAVAPHPVSNKQLILQISNKKKFYLPIHVPALALKLTLGEMSIEVLKSATVSSCKIEDAGFKFKYPTIKEAVENLES